MTEKGLDGNSFRDKERKRKESEQYLMMNFPADVRKNLKGIILPQERIDRKAENLEKEALMKKVAEQEKTKAAEEAKTAADLAKKKAEETRAQADNEV